MVFYKINHPGMSAISFGGRQYDIDPLTGGLALDYVSPDFEAELKRRGAVLITDKAQVEALQAEAMMASGQMPTMTDAERQERDALFTDLDTLMGRPIDRRRSLKQLREMMATAAEMRTQSLAKLEYGRLETENAALKAQVAELEKENEALRALVEPKGDEKADGGATGATGAADQGATGATGATGTATPTGRRSPR